MPSDSGQAGGEGDGPFDREEQRKRRRAKRRGAARMTDLSTVGLVFPVAMVVGFLGGRFLGSLFGAAETGGLWGGGFGLLAGFYNVYRTAIVLQQQDEAQVGDFDVDPSAPASEAPGSSGTEEERPSDNAR